MNVVDASAVVELLLGSASAHLIENRLFGSGRTFHAPQLLLLEVAQVLRRHELRGQMRPERTQQALADLAALPIFLHPHSHLLPRVWELRHNLTAYDAVYVALAEFLGAPLLTRDRRLANAAGHRTRIDLV